MKNLPGLYKVIQKSTGKYYLGCAKDVRRRKCEHFSALRNDRHFNPRLQSAWNNSTPDDFEFRIILYCSIQDIYYYESKLLQKLDYQFSFNRKHSSSDYTDERRQKISNSLKGHTVSKETRRKLSIATSINRIGFKYSNQSRAKMSIAAYKREAKKRLLNGKN